MNDPTLEVPTISGFNNGFSFVTKKPERTMNKVACLLLRMLVRRNNCPLFDLKLAEERIFSMGQRLH
jgi:hypothetical protein